MIDMPLDAARSLKAIIEDLRALLDRLAAVQQRLQQRVAASEALFHQSQAHTTLFRQEQEARLAPLSAPVDTSLATVQRWARQDTPPTGRHAADADLAQRLEALYAEVAALRAYVEDVFPRKTA